MVQLGFNNPPRNMVRRRITKMDTEALKNEHVYICGSQAQRDMIKMQKMIRIFDYMDLNEFFTLSKNRATAL